MYRQGAYVDGGGVGYTGIYEGVKTSNKCLKGETILKNAPKTQKSNTFYCILQNKGKHDFCLIVEEGGGPG